MNRQFKMNLLNRFAKTIWTILSRGGSRVEFRTNSFKPRTNWEQSALLRWGALHFNNRIYIYIYIKMSVNTFNRNAYKIEQCRFPFGLCEWFVWATVRPLSAVNAHTDAWMTFATVRFFPLFTSLLAKLHGGKRGARRSSEISLEFISHI